MRVSLPAAGIGARGQPVVIFQLQPLESGIGPAGGQVGAFEFGHFRIENRRGEGEQQDLRLAARCIAHRLRQVRGRLRQQRSGLVEQIGLCAIERVAHIGDDRRRAAERGDGGIVVQARRARFGHHPPPWFADLEPRRQGLMAHRCREGCGGFLQPLHRVRIGRRQQCRGRHPAGSRGRAVMRALLPVFRAMLGEQFVGQRSDRFVAVHAALLVEIAVPAQRGGAQSGRLLDQQRPFCIRPQPEEMTHPDIVQDLVAIAEPLDRAQQPRRGLVVGIVIGGRDALAMRRHQHVSGLEHGAVALAGNVEHLRIAADPGRKRGIAPGDIIGRHERDKHAVDIARMDRFAGQRPAAFERREWQFDLRVGRAAGGVVPQPHIPAARIARRVAALDRQRRAVGLVERRYPLAAPAKAQHAMRIVALRFVGEQRRVERVLAVPDQPNELALVVEFAIDAQTVGSAGDDRGHRRAGEIDGPETRIEALDEIGVLPVAPPGEPECHCRLLRADQRAPHRARDLARGAAERGGCRGAARLVE